MYATTIVAWEKRGGGQRKNHGAGSLDHKDFKLKHPTTFPRSKAISHSPDLVGGHLHELCRIEASADGELG